MKFEEIGRKIDHVIHWFKERFHCSRVYRLYARYGTRRYIKRRMFRSEGHLASYLEYAIMRGWFSAEESVKLIKKWGEVQE